MSITKAQYSELFEHLSRRTDVLEIDVVEINGTAVEWLIDDECLSINDHDMQWESYRFQPDIRPRCSRQSDRDPTANRHSTCEPDR